MKKRNVFIMVCVMAVSIGLCACGTGESDTSAVDVVEETGNIEQLEEANIETEEENMENTTEVVEEVSLYIPEGIDMESTIPGQEWLDSFVGKVNEPVVVIYNDNTGRKEVVQADSEVTVNPDEDIFAVYFPETSMGATPYSISIKDMIGESNYFIYIMDTEKMREIRKRNGKIVVRGGEEDWILEFKILVE